MPDCLFALARRTATTIIFLLLAAPSHAQQFPRWESLTGFSYAHVNLGQQTATFQPTDNNYYGMHINASFNPRHYLRIILCDFSVQLGGTTINIAPERADVRTSQILFGPEFIHRYDRSALFAHTLVGVTNTRLVSRIGGSDIVPDLVNTTNLAFGVGGGADFHLTRMIALRAIQADYIPTRMSGNWESHFRMSAGVVFRLGYQTK